jgi:uncharacterized membrane protein YqhA
MTDRLERDIMAMEKEIRQLKSKLDNSIIDIRAVNYWGFVATDNTGDPLKTMWDVVRHEIQYKRQGAPEWVPIPVIHRDEGDKTYTRIKIPTGDL